MLCVTGDLGVDGECGAEAIRLTSLACRLTVFMVFFWLKTEERTNDFLASLNFVHQVPGLALRCPWEAVNYKQDTVLTEPFRSTHVSPPVWEG